MVDVGIMTVMGLLGYLLRKLDFETAPMVLGVVLAPIIEMSLRQSDGHVRRELHHFFPTPDLGDFSFGALAMILLAIKPLIQKGLDWRARLTTVEKAEKP